MTFIAEGRLSESPYVESIWRGQADDDHTLMCPADGRLTIQLAKLGNKVQVSIEGPITQAVPKTHVKGIDWVVIKFKLGVFIPRVPTPKLLNGEVLLPQAAGRSFWLDDMVWELPDYENVDTFVDWLVRDCVIQVDPVISAALHDQAAAIPTRTLRHHFQRTIGLTQRYIRQIERARQAMALLQNDISILDVVFQMGYADQPHLTRSLKRFMGYTPVQAAQFKLPR
jgi:AraC-like DNA-binding protein